MKKYLLSLTVLMAAAATMAFTQEEAPAEAAVAVQYQFTGTQMADVYDTDLWSVVSGGGPACGGVNLPCVVSVPSGTIDAWLNARDTDKILKDAQTLKN